MKTIKLQGTKKDLKRLQKLLTEELTGWSILGQTEIDSQLVSFTKDSYKIKFKIKDWSDDIVINDKSKHQMD